MLNFRLEVLSVQMDDYRVALKSLGPLEIANSKRFLFLSIITSVHSYILGKDCLHPTHPSSLVKIFLIFWKFETWDTNDLRLRPLRPISFSFSFSFFFSFVCVLGWGGGDRGVWRKRETLYPSCANFFIFYTSILFKQKIETAIEVLSLLYKTRFLFVPIKIYPSVAKFLVFHLQRIINCVHFFIIIIIN